VISDFKHRSGVVNIGLSQMVNFRLTFPYNHEKTLHVHTVCGLTNVSYGLPARKLINRAFLTAAITIGLDSAIIDPTDKLLYAMLKAVTLIAGKDDFCMEYASAFRAGRVV
ncbi:MAG: hypothetical protein ACD_75C01740G0001, partial [uncultured bacterium]